MQLVDGGEELVLAGRLRDLARDDPVERDLLRREVAAGANGARAGRSRAGGREARRACTGAQPWSSRRPPRRRRAAGPARSARRAGANWLGRGYAISSNSSIDSK